MMRAVSNPSMLGICTSRRMSAKSSRKSHRRASFPDDAFTRRWPIGSRMASNANRFEAWSSTSRMLVLCGSTWTGARGVSCSVPSKAGPPFSPEVPIAVISGAPKSSPPRRLGPSRLRRGWVRSPGCPALEGARGLQRFRDKGMEPGTRRHALLSGTSTGAWPGHGRLSVTGLKVGPCQPAARLQEGAPTSLRTSPPCLPPRATVHPPATRCLATPPRCWLHHRALEHQREHVRAALAAELRLHLAAAGLAQALGLLRIFGHLLQLLREHPRLLRRHEQPIHAVVHQLLHAARARHHHRRAHGHGLHDGHAQRLLEA